MKGKKILFDTNIILDVLLNRQPHAEASVAAWAAAECGRVEGMIAAHAVTTITVNPSNTAITGSSAVVFRDFATPATGVAAFVPTTGTFSGGTFSESVVVSHSQSSSACRSEPGSGRRLAGARRSGS